MRGIMRTEPMEDSHGVKDRSKPAKYGTKPILLTFRQTLAHFVQRDSGYLVTGHYFDDLYKEMNVAFGMPVAI